MRRPHGRRPLESRPNRCTAVDGASVPIAALSICSNGAQGKPADHLVGDFLPALACRPDSAWHVLKLGDLERFRPCEATVGETLKHRLDALRVIQATERDEDRPRKALQVTGEGPRAAIGAEVPIQPLARLRDVMKCFRLAAD